MLVALSVVAVRCESSWGVTYVRALVTMRTPMVYVWSTVWRNAKRWRGGSLICYHRYAAEIKSTKG